MPVVGAHYLPSIAPIPLEYDEYRSNGRAVVRQLFPAVEAPLCNAVETRAVPGPHSRCLSVSEDGCRPRGAEEHPVPEVSPATPSPNGAAHAKSRRAVGSKHGDPLDPELISLSLVVILGAIMSILDTTIVNVAIDTLSKDFHSPLSTIQWVSTGYLLALSIVIPLSGWAVERFGAKRMWILSLVVFLVGSILSGCRLVRGSRSSPSGSSRESVAG